MDEKLLKKIKDLDIIAPTQEWKEAQKELLMTQVRAQVKDRKGSNAYGAVFVQFFKGLFELRSFSILFKRSSVAIMSVMLLLGVGVFGVQAAEKSLPGDFLYGVKRTKERVRVSLTSSEQQRAVLHIEFAERRLQEFAVLKEQTLDSDKKVKKMTVAVVDFKEEIAEIKEKLSKAEYTIKEPRKIIEVADLVDDKVGKFTEYLDKNIKSDTSDQVTGTNHLGIMDTVEDAIKAGEDVSHDAVTLLVRQKDKEGVDDSVKEEIKQKVIKKIEKARVDVGELAGDIIKGISKDQKKSVDKKEVVEEGASSTKESDSGQAALTAAELNSEEYDAEGEAAVNEKDASTPEQLNNTDDLNNNNDDTDSEAEEVNPDEVLNELPEPVVNEVKKVIEEDPKKAETLLTEAGQLADEGDLDQALEKLQATQSLVDEAKVKVDTIISTAIDASSQSDETSEQLNGTGTLENELQGTISNDSDASTTSENQSEQGAQQEQDSQGIESTSTYQATDNLDSTDNTHSNEEEVKE